MKNSKDWLFAFGAILVLAGAVMQIMKIEYAAYICGAGALIVFFFRLLNPVQSDDFRVKRLMRIQFLSSLLLIGSSYLMYIHNNAWAAGLFLAAFIDIFIIFRLPKA